MNKPSTAVIRRIFEESGRNYIEVGPWPDDPSILELRTEPGEFSAEFFGEISLTLTADMAEELGRALFSAALESRGITKE